MPLISYFYEIELKSLLSKGQYERLYAELPKRTRLFNEETIHTTRYRPSDIRLRYSDKAVEVVWKEGDPTKISRRELKIPLRYRKMLEYFSKILAFLNFHPDPPWTKHKREFEYEYGGFRYIVCLQNIENFAYILEVEFLGKRDDSNLHEPNLRNIIEKFGCEPIDPKDFSDRIKRYIEGNRLNSNCT